MFLAKFALLGAVLAAPAAAGDVTALDRYIAAPDPSYRYTLSRTITASGATVHQLDMVSQTWLTTAEVDRPEWRHWVTIYRPEKVSTSTAVLLINGGSNSNSAPSPDPTLALLASAAGAVVVDLGQVPNQPLRFAGESASRSEDAIIAYTWDKFLRTGDERWPARLPMTKAAVRAMDAATDFLAKLPTDPLTLRKFIVVGASKRGWTTWSTAAVDPRVIAIAPLVIDTLNVAQAFAHHWEAYGFWSSAVQDYVNAGIMNWFGTPQMSALLEIEDPYPYRERLALPTYQMASTGDQFFVPDSPRFYFADLPGEKYLRFVPNTDHSLASLIPVANLASWVRSIISNFPRPRFYWTTDRAAGTLTVRTIDTPTQLLLWRASNPKARDFRLESIGPAWTSTPIPLAANGVYTLTLPTPAQGWTASMVELTFPGPDDAPLAFTTEVVVTPDFYPFPSPFPAPIRRGPR